jgi:hypothetical protein
MQLQTRQTLAYTHVQAKSIQHPRQVLEHTPSPQSDVLSALDCQYRDLKGTEGSLKPMFTEEAKALHACLLQFELSPSDLDQILLNLHNTPRPECSSRAMTL